MARLFILIGFAGPEASATPSVVYVGRDANEAEAARVASSCERTLLVRNPIGIRKVNQAVAERMNHALIASREASLVPAASVPTGPGEEGPLTLLDVAPADQARIAELEAEIAALKTQVLWTAPLTKDEVKARLESMTADEISAEVFTFGVVFKEGTPKEEMIDLLLNGDPTFQGAPPQGEDANGEQGSTQLPENTEPGAGGGNPSGAQADGGGPDKSTAVENASTHDFPGGSTNPPTDPPSPGSMSPKGRRGK